MKQITPAVGHRARVLATMVLALSLLVTDAATSPDAAVAKPKRLGSGLMSVGNTGIWPGIVDVRVTYLNWRDLQPRPGRFRLGIISEIASRARASGDTLRLRIFAGRGAPGWVMQRYGTVRVYDPIDDIGAEVPKWWTRGYLRAYARFQRRLAARFDDSPTIRAVTVTGAMTIHGEPFIRGIASSVTRSNLLRSGYSPRKDRRAIIGSLRAHRPWHRTRQILNLNPWQFVRSDGSLGQDARFTNHAMDRFRSMFGRRAILQNNSIRSRYILDGMPTVLGNMYRHMRALGPPLSFQTAQTGRVGELAVVLRWCVDQGAHGVEVQRGAAEQISSAQAAAFDSDLEANA